jgi:putative transposase
MANYRRNFLAGGSFFSTVNLADRRLALLTDHIVLLRAAFRQVRALHPFTIEAAVILPDHLHAIWTLPEQDAKFRPALAPDQKRVLTRSNARRADLHQPGQ